MLTDWDIQSGRTIHVSMHNYEIDSLCYFLRLSYHYWLEMKECALFEDEWLDTAKRIVNLWIVEQHHDKQSSYTYPTLPNEGKGMPICYTGMTWGAYRPSDDVVLHHFSIPSNMFVVVVLRHLEEILESCYPVEEQFKQKVRSLGQQIDDAIAEHGVVTVGGKKVYAYEVNGCGDYVLMDDANVPSLLSMDYLGYHTKHDASGTIKRNTMELILSPANPFFFTSEFISGIG